MSGRGKPHQSVDAFFIPDLAHHNIVWSLENATSLALLATVEPPDEVAAELREEMIRERVE